MTDGMVKTLGIVVSKLTPRIILILLIAVILAFVVVISIAISSGSKISFLGFEAIPSDGVDGMTAHEFIATLHNDVQGTVEETRRNIETAVNDSKQQTERIETIIEELTNTKNLLIQVRKERDNLQVDEEKFLNRIIRLEERIARWDGFISTIFKVDKKEESFRLVQQLFRRIGYYNGPIDGDPIRTRDALVDYKKDKGFKIEKQWPNVTRQTVIFMVRDYAETLLEELKG